MGRGAEEPTWLGPAAAASAQCQCKKDCEKPAAESKIAAQAPVCEVPRPDVGQQSPLPSSEMPAVRRVLIMLVGLPGCGKSTFRRRLAAGLSRVGLGCLVISGDDFVEKYAAELGTTYKAAYKAVASQTRTHLAAQVREAKRSGGTHCVVIWDQTNLQRNVRMARVSSFLSEGVEKTYAIVFRQHFYNSHDVPEFVVRGMSKRFDAPTVDEGFTVVLDSVADDLMGESGTERLVVELEAYCTGQAPPNRVPAGPADEHLSRRKRDAAPDDRTAVPGDHGTLSADIDCCSPPAQKRARPLPELSLG